MVIYYGKNKEGKKEYHKKYTKWWVGLDSYRFGYEKEWISRRSKVQSHAH